MRATKAKKPTKSPSKKLKTGKKKGINKWLVLGGAAAIAIAGVVILRSSFAAGCSNLSYYRGYPWVRCAAYKQFVDYRGKALPTTSLGGRIYTKLPKTGGTYNAHSIVSKAEIQNSNDICAHVYNYSKQTQVYTIVLVDPSEGENGGYLWSNAKIGAGSTGNVCITPTRMKKARKINHKLWVMANGSPSYVDSVYGKK